MNRRPELHNILADIIGDRKRVYFQPPESVKLSYPCIIYTRYDFDVDRADNFAYKTTVAYSVSVIDKDPDNAIVEKILNTFEYCSFRSHYTVDNLHHDVLTIYF